jgi:hypothetical protein
MIPQPNGFGLSGKLSFSFNRFVNGVKGLKDRHRANAGRPA